WPLLSPRRDDRGRVGDGVFREWRERRAPAVSGGNQDAPDGFGVGPGVGNVAHGNVELPFAFEDAAYRAPADGKFDHILRIADVDAVPRHFVTFDADAQLRLLALLLNGCVRRAAYLSQRRDRLGGQFAQPFQVGAVDDHGKIGG